MTNGLFEVLAADRDQERVAATRAVIAAQTRAKQRFEKYVSAAASDDERAARLSVIAYDLDTELVRVAEEYGFGDIDHLRNAATVALGGGHAADCECGFCENKGKLPGVSDDEGDADEAEETEDMGKESSVKIACECCENCKNGESCSCEEHSKTSKIDVKQAAASASEFPWEHVAGEEEDADEGMETCRTCGERYSEFGDGYDGECPSCADKTYEREDGEHESKVAADVETGDSFAQERVDVASGPEASPKIDKSKVPANGLSEIDVPSKAHPSEKQSVEDTADYSASDFDPDSPTRDRIDANKPLQPEHNVADNTQTWTGTEGQASPVTSAVLAKWKVLP